MGECAVTAGILGLGKSIPSNSPGGSDMLIKGSARSDGEESLVSSEKNCGSSCNCLSGPAH